MRMCGTPSTQMLASTSESCHLPQLYILSLSAPQNSMKEDTAW